MNLIKLENEALPVEVVKRVEERLFAYNKAYADNTNRARAADYKIFKAWCDENCCKTIPVDPEDLERFLWDMASEPVINPYNGQFVLDDKNEPELTPRKSFATVARYLATIKYLHDVSMETFQEVTKIHIEPTKYRNPADTKRVRTALKAIRKKFVRVSTRGQALAIRLELIETVMNKLDDDLRNLLCKTLISVAFDTMMRRSELVRLEVTDITYVHDGSGSVHIGWSKTDQEGKGDDRYLSVTSIDLIHKWTAAANITEGRLFRSVNRAGAILDNMNPGRISKLFKRVARLCEMDEKLIKRISAHSTRVGAAQELVTDGVTLPDLMIAGGWKSSTMPAHYAKAISVQTGAMAKLSKHKGRS